MESLENSKIKSEIYSIEYFQQNNVCRLCWKENILCIMNVNGFDSEELVRKIKDCLSIDIAQVNYPKKLCSSCSEKINMFFEFKKSCIANETRLYEIFERNTFSDAKVSAFKIKTESDDKIPEYDEKTTKLETVECYFEELQGHNDHSDAGHIETVQSKANISLGKVLNLETDLEQRENAKVNKTIHNVKRPQKRSRTYCNICRLDLKTMEDFTEHNAQHHGVESDGSFKCFGCGKLYPNYGARLRHESNYCNELSKGFKCSLCNRFIPTRGMYEEHMRHHQRNKNPTVALVTCAKCQITFKTKMALKSHMATHKGEPKYVCEQCGRVFSRSAYLHVHRLKHAGSRRYACSLCDYSAVQKTALNTHMRRHTGERPFSCDLCPQRCISSSNLAAHRRRHLNLKNYECKLCPEKFSYKTSLEVHVASNHGQGKSHSCPHCGSLYSRKSGLDRHLKKKHKNVVQVLPIEVELPREARLPPEVDLPREVGLSPENDLPRVANEVTGEVK